jgi:nucleosome assembly protein 1-like 1
MSSRLPISLPNITAPTPQNTPLTQAPIAAGLSRPTVPDISEDKEEADDDEDSGPTKHEVPAAMLGLMQSKLASLVGKSSGYIEGLPVEIKRSIEALKGVQVKQIELQIQYKRECLELERKVCPLSSVFIIRFDEPRSRPFSTWNYSLPYMRVVMISSRARLSPPRKR